MLKEAPDNLFLIRWESTCTERFGNIKMMANDFTGAAQVFADTLELKQSLVDSDTANIQFQEDHAIILSKLEHAKGVAQATKEEN
jgi:hypothetical protein